MSDYDQLFKIDRRKQWKGLKAKHAKAISAAKLDFDQKLGLALDKYQSEVEKLTQFAGKAELVSMHVQPLLRTLEPLKKIVTTYKTTVKTLADPAKKEFADLLTAIEHDIASWFDLAVATMGTAPRGPNDDQKEAASNLMHYLENIRVECLMIVTRGPRVLETYKKENRPAAAALISHLIEASRTVGSAGFNLRNLAIEVTKGTNYEIFKARGKATQALLQKAHDAATEFQAKWVKDVDGSTLSTDIDTAALHMKCNDLLPDLSAAAGILQKLP